jgi:hypothetical protein
MQNEILMNLLLGVKEHTEMFEQLQSKERINSVRGIRTVIHRPFENLRREAFSLLVHVQVVNMMQGYANGAFRAVSTRYTTGCKTHGKFQC